MVRDQMAILGQERDSHQTPSMARALPHARNSTCTNPNAMHDRRQLEGLTKAQDGQSVGLVVSGKVGKGESSLAAQALAPVGVHGVQEAHQPHQRLPGHLPHLVLAVPGACMHHFAMETQRH